MAVMITPFPPRELAKLVLGYLAEEQLMTAYDEFLHGSPYLDALENEHDRVFMTPLRHIVAEYRALKIYVETCKPFALRRRLLGCANLLEAVKLLVQLVDADKLGGPEHAAGRHSYENVNMKTYSRVKAVCDVCSSLNRSSCACHVLSKSNASVETTLLENLPGHKGRKKHVKVLDKEKTPSVCSNELVQLNARNPEESSSGSAEQGLVTVDSQTLRQDSNRSADGQTHSSHSVREVSNADGEGEGGRARPRPARRSPPLASFREFAAGVEGKNTVPDSSTSECLNSVIPVTNGDIASGGGGDKRTFTTAHILLEVQHRGRRQPAPAPAPADHKITILSDVKVDKGHPRLAGGARAFPRDAPAPAPAPPHAYSRDEIMAMPTIILVPAPAPAPKHAAGELQKSTVHSAPLVSSSARALGPLLIDVGGARGGRRPESERDDQLNVRVTEPPTESDPTAAKVGEARHATVPKDAEMCNRSTPERLPAPRKASSTPRRAAHVRVLDFTTPRRVLSEPLAAPPPPPPPPPPSPSRTLHIAETADSDKNTAPKPDKSDDCALATRSIQKIITVKKSDWDADLRALAVANAKTDTPKPKAKSTRRRKGADTKGDHEKKSSRKSNVTKSTTKIKLKSVEVTEDSVEIVELSPPTVAVKPTINVITDRDWGAGGPDKSDPNGEDGTNTPEMERLSLQNAIGAKLNISDLLETPYKQVLYDIQMETPRFLGPDVACDPMSDIKISNIPTPRFLAAPPAPSPAPAYCSRPTDYSSGSSYYRPDDHDCLDIGSPAPPAGQTPPDNKDIRENKSKNKPLKSSRPVRKCTKNVSYVNSPNIKSKEHDKDDESVNSESALSEFKPSKTLKPKTPKTEAIRKHSGIKKRKTPVKKETPKCFMKIKPRRPTPVKDSGRRTKQSGTPGRKRTASRDKAASVTPAASAPAKSRRKSSTPRKLHCTKQFHSESSGHESPEMVEAKSDPTRPRSGSGAPDSDAEPPPLRWSDEGTRDSAPADTTPAEDATSAKPRLGSVNDTEDITKIQEYLATSAPDKSAKVCEDGETDLHIDLVRRGFDIETAKIIERDLLDPPTQTKENLPASTEQPLTSIGQRAESSIEVDVEGNDDEEDEIEFSVHECNEDTNNYLVYNHDDIKDIPRKAPEKLKDKFSIEVCIDDEISIRLRLTPLTFLIDENPKDEDRLEYNRETEMAVSSISGMAKLYTPLKDQRAQCYEIFDSTLTSLDTPLKVDTPRRRDPEMTVTEIVFEVEKEDVKDRAGSKRKRAEVSGSASDESASDGKRPRADAQYLLNPANIKNIDIETVLCKLHGP